MSEQLTGSPKRKRTSHSEWPFLALFEVRFAYLHRRRDVVNCFYLVPIEFRMILVAFNGQSRGFAKTAPLKTTPTRKTKTAHA